MERDIPGHQKIIAASQNLKEKEFWLKQFSGKLGKTGFPGGLCQTGAYPQDFKAEEFWIKGPMAEKLREISAASDYRLHIVLMAGLILLLCKSTGNRDIVIGTPVYRSGSKGKFINTVLPIKARVKEDMTFQQLLKQVGTAFREAVAHQNYPMEILAQQLAPGDAGDDFPLFDVSLLLENIHDKSYICHIRQSMIFCFSSYTTGILGLLEYNPSRWDRTAVERIIDSLQRLLEETVFKPDSPIYPLNIFSMVEKPGSETVGEKVGEGSEGSTAPRNPVEKKLAVFWAEVLEIETETIGIHSTFFDLRGDSLKAIMLASRIQKEFNVNIPLPTIFKFPTIAEIAGYIKKAAESKFFAISPVEEKKYFAVSSAQKRLFVLQQFNPESTVYNIPIVLELEKGVNRNKLELILTQLIRRHETFRTSFEMVDEEPMQKIHQKVDFKIETIGPDNKTTGMASSSNGIKKILDELIRPFDLGRAPLVRVGLIERRNDTGILVWDTHHIIMDATSRRILGKEFTTLYQGKTLPEPRLQYKDYSEWKNLEKEKPVIKHQQEYWNDVFSGEIPVLNLPTDYSRPTLQSFEGGTVGFPLGSEESESIRKLARENEVTLFMLLISLYNIFLAKICSQQDIVIGTPVVGRRHADLEQIIGIFINTLALRNFPRENKGFKEFLLEVRARIIAAFENQDHQFEDLVEEIVVNRDVSRNPLFDAGFSLYATDTGPAASYKNVPGNLKPKPYEFDYTTSKFDLTLYAADLEEDFYFHFEYSSRLFKKETIERFISYFKKMVSSLLENPGKIIKDLEILPEGERMRILMEFNNPISPYQEQENINRVFDDQVKRNPHKTAVIFGQAWLTYEELANRSIKLSKELAKKGINPGDIAAILIDRSLEMITGIMAILRSGAGYLPIAPGTPQARIQFMIEDSGTSVLLTRANILENHSYLREQGSLTAVFRLDEHGGTNVNAGFDHPGQMTIKIKPKTPAYLIYTSGTSGEPKGVLVTHRNIINLVLGLHARIYQQYPPGIRAALLAPYVFDASVKQIFAVLLLGHSLFIATEEARLAGAELVEFYRKYDIEISDGTPAHLLILTDQLMASSSMLSLKNLLIGGEGLSKQTVQRFFYCFPANTLKVTNVYGPTECSVDSTCFEITTRNIREFNTIPIGAPLHNVQVYIIDQQKCLQPIGIPGEIGIAGAGVARGYFRRESLTAQKFIPNPFQEGERMYCSGDVGKWLPDGNIEFLGRLDNQVKIRGYRIEPGEIENCLLKHDRIKHALVIPRDDGMEEKYLCAYLVISQRMQTRDGNVNPDRICRNLAKHPDVKKVLIKVGEDMPADHPAVAYVIPHLERAPEINGHPRYRLPNNRAVVHLNKNETDYLYREQFQEQAYFKHGITLKQGDCVFDIGANIGLFTLAAHWREKKLKIYAFEPIPGIFQLLHLNMLLYGVKGKAYNCGLANRKGTASYTYYPKFSFLSGLYGDKEEEKKVIRAYLEHEKTKGDKDLAVMEGDSKELLEELLENKFTTESLHVQLRTLSDIIAENQLKVIDLLKINVEKSELDVLMGIRAHDWPKIRQIALEVHNINGRLKKVTALLEQYGFETAVEQDWTFSKNVTSNYYVYGSRNPISLQSSQDELFRVDKKQARQQVDPLLTSVELSGFLKERLPGESLPSNIVILDPLYYKDTDKIDLTALPLPGKGSCLEKTLNRELKEYLAAKLPGYMIPTYFISLEKIPLTSSGKVDRKALPAPVINTVPGQTRVSDNLERTLIRLWSTVLGIDEEKIGIDLNFFDAGGHSLKAALLISRIYRTFDVKLPLTEVFKTPTIRGLATCIRRTAPGRRYREITPVPDKEYYALSAAQTRLYVQQQLDHLSTRYNVNTVVVLEGKADKEKLVRIFRKLIHQHESFRTSFIIKDGLPVQKIHQRVDFGTAYFDLMSTGPAGLPLDRRIENFVQPFDLSRAPLVRVGLIKIETEKHILLVDMHHIISDGISFTIIVKEFMALYAGKEIPQSRLRYRDFSEWQKRLDESGKLNHQEEFWIKELDGEIPVLNLPIDFKRPRVQRFEGESLYFEIESPQTAAIKKLAAKHGVTLYMVLLSLYFVFLSRITGQEDIVLGTPMAGRSHPGLERVVGMFVNMLPLRNYPEREKSFREFLIEVSQRTMAAIENQEYPFIHLVEKRLKNRDPGRHPLFDVIFVFEQVDIQFSELPGISIPGLKLTPYSYRNRVSRFDFGMGVNENAGRLFFRCEYSTTLFKSETIKRFVDFFKKVIAIILKEPDICLKDITLELPVIKARPVISQKDREGFNF